ncbi:UbiA prenyltransferase [Emticicia oligotrophica DSM 17448]|uniref:UbiA prenyltransferase n=1 Tax=Emticicia oligotrophica (strain DSM 17448 / CIP 109782 / MTCC 6937 / GPTSA100-15) TaxID=929562 RepID=A0ABM5N3X2_EMTOG|nr:geranylgeranylglycerol-phosphate geranylgeranyltransferase [Emticicia oligotrophica]AFK04171.1 UbiA prenyltransferase [Emticicia oligotrophica DSM 17448]
MNYSLLETFKAFFKLIRFVNILIVVLTQYMVRIFLIGPKGNWFDYLLDIKQFLLVFSTISIAAAGYIINDYFDVKIDLVNKPNEVIIGKIIKRRRAILIHQILNAIGLLIGLYLSWKVFLIDFVAISALWFYSERFKRMAFIGNFLVAFLTAFSVVIVGVYYQKNIELVNVYSLFAFSISLIREIIKDMEDIRGDARYGCRTLPIIWGLRQTKILLYVFIVSFVMILLSMAYSLKNHYLLYFFSFGIFPFSWFVYKLYWADKRRDFTFLSKVCKIIMLIGVASMIFI